MKVLKHAELTEFAAGRDIVGFSTDSLLRLRQERTLVHASRAQRARPRTSTVAPMIIPARAPLLRPLLDLWGASEVEGVSGGVAMTGIEATKLRSAIPTRD